MRAVILHMENSCLHRNSKTLKIINFVFASGSNLLMTELAVYNDTYDYLEMKNWHAYSA